MIQVAPRSRLLRRSVEVAVVLAVVLSVPVAVAEAGAPVGIAQSFPTKCTVGDIAAGKEGNAWFTCYARTRAFLEARPKIGRVTPAGQVSEFGDGLAKNSEPREIVAAADGDLWFTLDTFWDLRSTEQRPPPRIGRVSPTGELTTYPLGLAAKYGIDDLVASPNGYLWFDAADSLWQISPLGTISRLPIDFGENSVLTLAVGPEGNLWFARKPSSGPGGTAIGRLTPAGELSEYYVGIPDYAPGRPIASPDGSILSILEAGRSSRLLRISPTGEISQVSTKLPGGGILGGAVIGADGNLWYGDQTGWSASAIGRVTASGEVTEFRDCLLYGQPFFGPAELVLGADGNLWFTSLESRSLPNISDPPSIGRVTPSGEITQIFAGVNAEAHSIVAASDGAVWFSGGAEEIERIAPITAPINTFHIGREADATASGKTTLPLRVPGPGKIEARPQALLLGHGRSVRLPGKVVGARASACGSPDLRLRPVGAAKRAFRRHGEASERIAITFTPDGGTPYTETATVGFVRSRSR
jgi:streptogramin lyase